jgi:glycosyltransferase involved in cell wall biosynthesis
MKVLHVCAIAPTAKILLQPQLKYFLSRNLEVGVACSPGKEVEELQKAGFKVHEVQIDRKISPFSNLKSIYQLVQIIKYHQYDLVHVHTPIAAVLGRIAAKLAGAKRIVYTSHGLPFHDLSSPKQYFLYSSIEKLTAKITDLIISQNHEDVSTVIKLGLCPPEKIAYLGNGVDIERFQRSRITVTHQNELRQSLGIPETANLIIGTIGRLTRKKGSGYLIEAVAKILPEFPNLHVLIIGAQLNSDPEPFQTELVQRIQALGIEKNVIITGERQDIPEILGLLDIFTLPTFTHEGLPRSIVEAMSMSLPVVATDIRGCREAVLHGRTGLIVPPQNSDKLADALRTLLLDSDLRQAYGKAGRLRVETEYDESFVFQRLENFYRELGVLFE